VRKILRTNVLGACLVACLAGVSAVQAADINVSERTEVAAAPGAVWALVGGFGVLDRWHPAVASTKLQGDGRTAGDLRLLTLGDGAMIVERLLSYDDGRMTLQYAILDSPLPVSNYTSALEVRVGSGGKGSIVTWSSSFDAKGASADDARGVIVGIYQAGFQQLHKLFSGK